ncbi:reprolysin-like metallopeptidase [Membranihabitans marinus]|uniref:reprolysin-like metallopeptidase n=1 Tax=Membranihabitans marinus TaxID=1227546 RepID=UPI001F31107E|nr:zinc-dependent metalloprotease family protein [Membranihabitans marinus]
MLRSIFVFGILLICISGYSQQWTPVPISDKDQGLPFFNSSSADTPWQIYTFDHLQLRSADLSEMELPTTSGEILRVNLVEDPLFAPGLQEKYPHLRSYNIHTEDWIGRLTWNDGKIDGWYKYQGQWMVVEHLQANKYVVYLEKEGYQTKADKSIVLGSCLTPGDLSTTELEPEIVPELRADNVSLRVYDLAVSTTSTYSARYGGEVASVLAQINIVFNRVNVVFQRELGLKFRIIDDVPELIYLTDDEDPYFEGNNNAMLNKAGSLFNSVVGINNYDIGHLLATNCGVGTAGVSSGIGTVCNSNKGQALSCDLTQNLSDYVRVLTHELGHQLGAEHSWSNCPGLNDVQRTSSSAVEPGSGSTIMSYISSCGEENLTVVEGPLYFHAKSIAEMNYYMDQGSGSTCISNESAVNHHPEIVSLPKADLVIPIKTAFFLEAQAQDEDGDELTYNWEQMDVGPISPLGSPIQTAPMFRSFPPDSEGKRNFPQLSTQLSNVASVEEVLPTYSRNMNFRLTVRDFDAIAGGMAIADYQLKSTANAGPFVLGFPNLATDDVFAGGLTTITWDVANTDVAPVNASHVKIFLSVDGGNTYPYVLAESTENRGLAVVQIPNVVTDQARIMVVGEDHIFYDISDEDLRIQLPSEPTYGLNIKSGNQTLCLPDTGRVEIQAFPVLGFADSIEYFLDNPYSDVDVFISRIHGKVNDPVSIDFVVDDNFSSDTLEFQLLSKAPGLDTFKRDIKLFVVNNNFSGVQAIYPSNNEVDIELAPNLTWSTLPNVDYYSIDVSESADFGEASTVFSETNISSGTYVAPVILDGGRVYFWRIRSHNTCGQDEDVKVYGFKTAGFQCESYTSGDLPKGVGGSSPGSVVSEIPVSDDFVIDDVNIRQIKGFHESVDQLQFSIAHNDTKVVLYDGDCGVKSFDFNISFDDDVIVSTDCNLNSGATVRPFQRLSNLYGQSSAGQWTMTMKDSVIGAGGLLNEWTLELCGKTISPSLSLSTDSLRVGPMSSTPLTSSQIQINDYNNLLFELVSLPQKGQLLFNNQVLSIGGKWTGSDLIEGRVVYQSLESTNGFDEIDVSVVLDNEAWSGIVSVPVVIDQQVSVTGITSHHNLAVYPNPVSSRARISAGSHIDWRYCQVYDVHGRLVHQQSLNPQEVVFELNTESWAAGMYFVVVSLSDKSLYTIKLQQL